MGRERWVGVLLGSGALWLGGCAQPYDRVVVAGVLVPVTTPVPAPGVTLVPQPPLPGLPADTTDGATLVAVDERQCLRDTGLLLPAWRPTPAPTTAADPLIERLTAVAADLTAILRAIDARGASSPAPAAGASPSAPLPGASAPGATSAPAVPPVQGDWSLPAARLLALAEAIDAWRTAATTEEAPHGALDPRDGAAVLAARQAALWEGMAARAQTLAEAVAALLASPRWHAPAAASGVAERTAVAAAATAVAAIVRERTAVPLLPQLRVLQARLDALDALPWVGEEQAALAAGAAGAATPAEPTIRARIVPVRRALVALAAQWGRNTATLLVPQPVPLLVYDRPVDLPAATAPPPEPGPAIP